MLFVIPESHSLSAAKSRNEGILFTGGFNHRFKEQSDFQVLQGRRFVSSILLSVVLVSAACCNNIFSRSILFSGYYIELQTHNFPAKKSPCVLLQFGYLRSIIIDGCIEFFTVGYHNYDHYG